ncbi:MAG TPA: DUF1570 domain-containing protein [Gemmataceae bacterium]|nr:DUF1570 domain-containing protein [Gemmataceae bacterium]
MVGVTLPERSLRRWRWLLGVLAATLAESLPAGSPGEDDWKFDLVHLRDGRSLPGLVVEQTATDVRFLYVSRKPGSPTFVTPVTWKRSEIERVELLDAKERERLVARLKALDPGGKDEAERMARLTLKAIPWGKDPRATALRYQSAHFTLESNAAEDVVRRAAVRLEQLYSAFVRYLPPRAPSAEPTTILLARSLADYQTLLKDRGHNLLNPAYYDPVRNQVVCGSELQRLGDELERVRRQHHQLLAELQEREAELHKLYKGRVPPQLLTPIREGRQKIAQADAAHEKNFREATQRLFRRLYHEAFHAYLDNFVYPGNEAVVPRWLNEGLAQIFESGFVEAGEMRIGHVEKDRLERLKEAIRQGELVGLADLLRSGPKQFLVAHDSERQVSNRHYLTSWALVHYLVFERRLLGTRAMDRYTRALGRGTDPLEAFRDLVSQPLPSFEKEFRRYLTQLRPDGSAGP